jgi:hypothetical protein
LCALTPALRQSVFSAALFLRRNAGYRNSDMENLIPREGGSLLPPHSSTGGILVRMRTGLVFGLAFVAVSLTGAARAEVKMSGSFVADAACPATQAIKSGKNPGNISTDAGQSYDCWLATRMLPRII